MDITTRLEFDAGHRIPNHKSNCKNLHGHRYAIEVTVTGPIHEDNKSSDFGMVIDFSDVKQIIKDLVVECWDHAFIVYQDDKEIVNFLNTLPNHKTVMFPVVGTRRITLTPALFKSVRSSAEYDLATPVA